MFKTKASDISILRGVFREKGSIIEKEFLQELDSETQWIFHNASANDWIAHDVEAKIITAAAKVLFPHEDHPLRALGHHLAKITFTGIYKAFIGLAKISFMVKRAPLMWRTLNDKGELVVVLLEANRATLQIQNNPEFSLSELQFDCGYIIAILELTGAKNVRISENYQNPLAWEWQFSWDS
jgi:uncharacterized protein (TIGR02265 family)